MAGFFSCMKLITITTDFKDQFAAAQVEAVAICEGFTGQLIENHGVTPYAITEGAFQIHTLARYCPPKTIHVGVVDPSVGSKRKGIIIKTQKSWLVGPDNGLLWPACRQAGRLQVWQINEKYFGKISPTFHGRDIFIKAAVWLSQGKSPVSFGCKSISRIHELEFKEGQIVHIDSYGNAKIWGNGHLKLPKVKTFSELPPGAPGLVWGSSDTWEIVVNQNSAKEKFGLKLGQVINKL